jgi:phage terminase large subunit
VRQLLIDKIVKLGLESHFDILENRIEPRNGGRIIFRGMQSYNAENIKSLEDFDGAWIEEAQTLGSKSLRLLRPTIRKPGSELWFSWNPRHETDPVDEFFRGGQPHPDAICVEVNWRDNPWFPGVLDDERRHDERAYPDLYEHVWEGGYEIITEASYFARLVQKAEQEGRVGAGRYQPHLSVHTSWDIGVDDYTSIWFWQDDGVTIDAIDYWEGSGYGAEDAIAEAMPELLPDRAAMYEGLGRLHRAKAYRYGLHYFPHDVANREWGGGGRSRIEILNGLGIPMDSLRRGAQGGPEARIPATRALLPRVRFADNPRVKRGLAHLRRYSRKFNEQMQIYTGPLHDEHSHCADAFGEFAVNAMAAPGPQPPARLPKAPPGGVRVQSLLTPKHTSRLRA